MKKTDKIAKKPLTEDQIQDTLKEYREAVELIRTRGTRVGVYGVLGHDELEARLTIRRNRR